METTARWIGTAAVLAAMLVGCAPAGAAAGETRFPGARNTVIHGEVRSVDTRSGQIRLRQDRGRNVAVRYDGRTSVIYRQRRYPVTALERGDRVTVRVVRDRRGQAIANRIDVRESVRDRGRVAARVQRVDGTVGWVDSRRGSFGLDVGRRTSIVVLAPRDLARSERSRLQRLRRGDRVRLEVRALGRDQYELVRFR